MRLYGRDIELRGRPVYCKRCTAKADREIARMPRVDCRVRQGIRDEDPFRPLLLGCVPRQRRAPRQRRYQRRYEADPEKHALKMARARAYDAARRARARW